MTTCAHPSWTNNDGATTLQCAACAVPWPGCQLPVPEQRMRGYGDLSELPGWGKRVRAMSAELAELEREEAAS